MPFKVKFVKICKKKWVTSEIHYGFTHLRFRIPEKNDSASTLMP